MVYVKVLARLYLKNNIDQAHIQKMNMQARKSKSEDVLAQKAARNEEKDMILYRPKSGSQQKNPTE
ncbi:hypothetical protein GCM10007362_21510 [Saccharibacillus endophyticus]|uniref:Uncharacterized protein n=1 Tax=Saccharibacillus endophyticus TaxID=2060666 RepID=A0ABQ1ZVB9_9BACL|nr:hypothetical protein GCM10007362_21510 [Saccharibacillus endophyticus]